MFINNLLIAAGTMHGVKHFDFFKLLVNWVGCLLLGLITAIIVLGIPICIGKLIKIIFKKKTTA